MSGEESNLGANNYRDRAIKAFASYGISLNPQQLEGKPYKQLVATLDYREGANERIGIIDVTFEGSATSEEEYFLHAGREISRKGGFFGAGITCLALVVKGEVKEYKIHFASYKSGYMVVLNPAGVVQEAYQEYAENDDQDYGEIVSLIQKFPPFPVLLQRFITTPLDPNDPSSLFSALGNLPNELTTRLELKAGS